MTADPSVAALLQEIQEKLKSVEPIVSHDWACPPELEAAWGNDAPWYALHGRSRAEAELITAAPRLLAEAVRVIQQLQQQEEDQER